ncbi:MAG: DUF11 domain-containing protein [Pseudomonadota bacterium]|nr:MAG: DUF11 domain-containing protein [Pseudomonadota bacterium]
MRANPVRLLPFVAAALLLAGLQARAGSTIPWFSEDFAAFEGSGFSATPGAGQLDSARWRALGLSDGDGSFGGQHDSGDFARGASPGGVTTGGVYAFDVGSATLLGVQPAGSDFTPGSFGLRLENTSGAFVDAVELSYRIGVYNDQGRANSLELAWSTDDSAYTAVSALDYTTPGAADASPAWQLIDRSTMLTGLGLDPGDTLYLRWQSDDVSGGGSRDELGITGIEVDIIQAPAVSIAKSGPEFATDGDSLSFELVVSNLDGSAPLTNLVVTDELPAGLVYVSDTSGTTPTEPQPGTLVWSLADLAAGGSVSFTLVASVSAGTAPASLVNQAEVTAELNGSPVDDQADWSVDVYELVSIFDIQTVADPSADDGSPLLGSTVFVDGVVTAAPGEIEGPGVAVIQDGLGGPYSGLVVNADFSALSVARGDELRVLGEVIEPFGLTRIAGLAVEVRGSPGPLAPAPLTTADFPDALPAASEPWEGVLLAFTDVEVTGLPGFGEWLFDDGSGPARADDAGSITVTPQVGDQYAFLRGIGWYSFDNYKIQPRSNADIDFVPELRDIHEIQGEGLRSPFAPVSGNDPGTVVRTEHNIVTALAGNGFFIQMPDDRDSSDLPLASRGLFVFTGSAPAVAVGDQVHVTGAVAEFHDFSQIANPDSVEVIASGQPLPLPVVYDANTPSPDPAVPSCGINNFECFEGMRISVPGGLITAPNQRFGSDPVAEAFLTATGMRAVRGPGVAYPGLGAACPTCPVWSGAPEVFEIDFDRLGLTNPTVAAGTTVSATGVLGFEFSGYELWPTDYALGAAPALPVAAPQAGVDELSIGSLNALDLFDSQLDGPRPIPACGAGYIANDREVLSPAEYATKLDKLAATIVEALNAPDVLALQEVESESTLQDLADQVGILTAGALVYTPYLLPGNDRGNINNGFLVNTDRVAVDAVTQLGADECLSLDDTPLHDRPPLLLEARFIAGGDSWPFVVMNNHLRSLGGIDSSARTRLKRHEQAQSVAASVQALQQADPLLPIVLVGDKNAFQFSDGYVDVIGLIRGLANPAENFVNIENAGTPGFDPDNRVSPPLVSPLDSLPAGQRYSFIFRGVSQVLDHALLSRAASWYFSDFGYMRGNADYWVGFGDDDSTLARSSDHDGLVVVLAPGRDIDSVFADRFRAP